MVGTPEAVDCMKKMSDQSIIGNAHYNFAEECKSLYGISGKKNATKGHSKYNQRESKSKLKKLFYYVQNKHDAMMTDLKKKVAGMRRKKANGYMGNV